MKVTLQSMMCQLQTEAVQVRIILRRWLYTVPVAYVNIIYIEQFVVNTI